MDLNALAACHLDDARARTSRLLEPLADDELVAQFSPLMSPLVWDLAHIAHYEELWLLRALVDAPATDPRFDDLYDAFQHPRRERAALPILGPDDARAYAHDVRTRVLDVLDGLVLDGLVLDKQSLSRDGFVYGMVIQHEHQHQETMLATIDLMARPYPHQPNGVLGPCVAAPDARGSTEVRLPGGPFVMGTDAEPWAYDNERPAHLVDIAPFRIDRTPVTNDAYRAFIDDRGYDESTWWSPAGWAWRNEARLVAPHGWHREGKDTWSVGRFGHRVDLAPGEPVQHVCWYEADAFARWAGKRLPTEAEWEYAASWSPDRIKGRYPWGDHDPTPALANLARLQLGPDDVRVRPGGATATGVLGMVGDVWEWTSTTFAGYPNFVAFPYREYSEVFFGDEYRVLRGGSWATHPSVARTTFRNWDFPIRRQIFSGFRCARDA